MGLLAVSVLISDKEISRSTCAAFHSVRRDRDCTRKLRQSACVTSDFASVPLSRTHFTFVFEHKAKRKSRGCAVVVDGITLRESGAEPNRAEAASRYSPRNDRVNVGKDRIECMEAENARNGQATKRTTDANGRKKIPNATQWTACWFWLSRRPRDCLRKMLSKRKCVSEYKINCMIVDKIPHSLLIRVALISGIQWQWKLIWTSNETSNELWMAQFSVTRNDMEWNAREVVHRFFYSSVDVAVVVSCSLFIIYSIRFE